MQKIPFAFRLGAQPRALMHTRIRAAANLCGILLHYYHSWSPVQLIIAWDVWIPTCSATYVACTHSESSRMKAGIPPAVPTLPSDTPLCFHDATCSAAGGAAEPQRRCSLSRHALWLEFWSCKIFGSHLFSHFSPPFISFLCLLASVRGPE